MEVKCWGGKARNGFKPEEGRWSTDIRGKNYGEVVKHWNRSLREVVGATSLNTLRVRLDRALGTD